MAALVEERARKRARIQAFVGAGQCCYKALVRVLEEVRRQPELLDDVTSARGVSKAMHELMREVGLSIDVPTISGVCFPWVIGDLGKVLALLVERSPSFADLMAASYAAHPASPAAPWRFVLAEDELTPGVILRLDNKRKVLAHHVSFLEFGPWARKDTAAWIPVGVLPFQRDQDAQGRHLGPAKGPAASSAHRQRQLQGQRRGAAHRGEQKPSVYLRHPWPHHYR